MPRALVLVLAGLAALCGVEVLRALARLRSRRSPLLAAIMRRTRRSVQAFAVLLTIDLVLRDQHW